MFEKSFPKILFLTKEPNFLAEDTKTEEEPDYRTWWSNENGLYDRFTYRIAEWAHGMLNGFPEYDEIWPVISGNKYDSSMALKALASIAFMNIKKSGGGGNSNQPEIDNYLKDHKSLILKQIEIIQPDIIIQGLTRRSIVRGFYGDVVWHPTGYTIEVARFQYQGINAKIIDFYHPSTRSSAAALYCLLEKVCKSNVFQER
ncbi:MAG: hypothetical protein MJA84_02055 [Firmicutes bacterium]|nr:hypothetical protein [Bacillota bacterium]